ncbi:hypothetical protein QP948_08845 [Corynebacterium bovis]|uniref:pyroglutamyl-peptidase I family protein n=1 Tax=Corynebacterium bovis TaxID=36808 RepID=UPI00254B962A|nr:hypothetical protein [Corynebacterium bovis]MDK8511493.1 hypothetical protein [Corynebacterium bovis]
MTVLITGFEPFRGRRHNTSWDVARAVTSRLRGNGFLTDAATSSGGRASIDLAQLPVVFGTVVRELPGLVQVRQPRVAVCLGERTGTDVPLLETRAVNAQVGRDNSGADVDRPILPGGEGERVLSPDVVGLLEEVEGLGVSDDAGRYVCNTTLWTGLDLARQGEVDRFVFIHVPALEAGDAEGLRRVVGRVTRAVEILARA